MPVSYDEQDFHGTFTYRTVDDLPQTWRRGLEMQKNLLVEHLSARARVLEIGCGQGFFLSLLIRSGLRAQGIEPSRSASRAARGAGMDVVEGYFSAEQAPAGPFDAIVVSHVLEHVEHPEIFLADISAVAPGGLLLLVQANWRGWVPRKTKSLWHAWAEGHHYWHFTPQGLRSWLESKGCTFVALEHSSLEHGGYWLSRLARWFPGASDQFHLLMRLPLRSQTIPPGHSPSGAGTRPRTTERTSSS